MKRIVDETLLDKYRCRPCDVCGEGYRSDPHHIRSKGSGGDDVESNIISCCRICHSNIHQQGYGYMWRHCPKLKDILTKKGWVFSLGKLRRIA